MLLAPTPAPALRSPALHLHACLQVRLDPSAFSPLGAACEAEMKAARMKRRVFDILGKALTEQQQRQQEQQQQQAASGTATAACGTR